MRIKLSLIAPAIALIAAPALASGPNATEFDKTVEHGDLDLTTKNGVALLDERVKTIIRRQCANGGRDSDSIRLERQCRASAYAAAESEVRFAISTARQNAVRLASRKPVAEGA